MEFNNRLLLKILELAFAIICVIFLESFNSYTNHAMLIYSTFGGYAIICSVLAIGIVFWDMWYFQRHLIGSTIDKRINLMFSLIGCILFIASGALIIHQWSNVSFYVKNKNAILSAGSIGLINGAVFLVDTIALCIAAIVIAETIGSTILSTKNLLVCGTLGGFTIVTGIVLIGIIINSPIEKRLNGLIAIIGTALFITSGSLVIDEWHNGKLLASNDTKNKALAAGSLMIVNGVVFLIDTVCTFRG